MIELYGTKVIPRVKEILSGEAVAWVRLKRLGS
jgi:hypothetical protein